MKIKIELLEGDELDLKACISALKAVQKDIASCLKDNGVLFTNTDYTCWCSKTTYEIEKIVKSQIFSKL